jgi:hypothetical protein
VKAVFSGWLGGHANMLKGIHMQKLMMPNERASYRDDQASTVPQGHAAVRIDDPDESRCSHSWFQTVYPIEGWSDRRVKADEVVFRDSRYDDDGAFRTKLEKTRTAKCRLSQVTMWTRKTWFCLLGVNSAQPK